MSKIPQGEWDAIAARYARGESITRIAQTYGCTPPAIHYILKRGKQRTAPNNQQPPTAVPQASSTLALRPPRTEAGTEIPRPVAPPNGALRSPRTAVGEDRPASPQPLELRSAREPQILPAPPMQNGRPQPTAPQQPSGVPRSTARASAFTAGLDNELHGRAEAAIAAFRSSFDAALAEGSPHVRRQLRQAASDLMRVAARTTIVLDRLNAAAEHAAGRAEGQSSSGHHRF
jgi:hypothetical protein